MNLYEEPLREGVTRRGFMQMAAGAITVLPSVVGGFLVPAPAYAAEDDSEEYAGELNSTTTRVEILKASETGFYVVDIAAPKEGNPPQEKRVPNAHIRVTSLYNGRTVEGVTNDEGIVRLDIAALSENDKKLPLDQLTKYSFEGTIAIEAEGYRTFETGRVLIKGGVGLRIPTRSITAREQNVPYAHMVTLSSWDVLYTTSTFDLVSTNDIEHEFMVEIRGLTPNTDTVIGLKFGTKPNKPLLLQTVVSDADGVATTTFKGRFLQDGHDDAFPEGDEFSLTYKYGKTTKTINLGIVTEKMGEEVVKDNIETMSPLELGGMDRLVGLRWPNAIPIIGGEDIDLPFPKFPVMVRLDPWGFLEISVTLPWGLNYETKNEDGGGWEDQNPNQKRFGWGSGTGWENTKKEKFKENFGEECTKWWGENYKDWGAAKSAWQSKKDDPGNKGFGKYFGKYHSIGEFSVNGTASFILCASWEETTEEDESGEEKNIGMFRGAAALDFLLAVSGYYTMQFFAGPVPVLVTFGLDSSLSIRPSFECYSPYEDNGHLGNITRMWGALIRPDKWKYNKETTAIHINLNFSPYASAGIGVRGVNISLELRFTFSMYLGFVFSIQKVHPELPWAHFIIGAEVVLNLVLKTFLFTKTWKLLSILGDESLYDNWDGKTEKDRAKLQAMYDIMYGEGLEAMASKNLYEMLNEMAIITDGLLEEMSETQGSSALQSSDDEEGVFDWEDVRQPNQNGELTNGEVLTYAVYSIPSAEDEPEDTDDVIAQTNGVVALGEVVADSVDATELGGQKGVTALGGETIAAPAKKSTSRLALGSSVVYDEMDHGLAAMAEEGSRSIVPEPGVKSLGRFGGITPSSDVAIAEGVVGDPRIKIEQFVSTVNVDALGSLLGVARATYAFRVGSVMVNGKPKTRVIMTLVSFEGGLEFGDHNPLALEQYDYNYIKEHMEVEKVIDFDMNDVVIDGQKVSHVDLYDYDFDVTCRTATRKIKDESGYTTTYEDDYMELVIISGKRNEGDNTTIADAATSLVFTHLSGRVSDLTSKTREFSWSIRKSVVANDIIEDNGYPYHSINNIHCVLDDKRTDHALLVAFLDRMAYTPEDVLSSDGGVNPDGNKLVRAMPGFFIVDYDANVIRTLEMDSVKSVIGGRADDASIFELDLTPTIGGYNTLSMRSSSTTHFFLLRIDEATGLFKTFEYGGYENMYLVPYPVTESFQGFLASMPYYVGSGAEREEKRKLVKVTWDLTDIMKPKLVSEDTGLDDFGVREFAVNRTGTYIFWPQSHEGENAHIYDYNDDPNAQVNNDDERQIDVKEPDLPSYQLMACRITNMKFSDPFVAAELEHSMLNAQLVVTNKKKAPIEVLSKTDVDAHATVDKSGDKAYTACNINFTSIPHLRCITAISCAAVNPFMMPGGSSYFDIMLRNDGNTFLRSCSVKMYEHNAVPDGVQIQTNAEGKLYVMMNGKEVRVVEMVEETLDKISNEVVTTTTYEMVTEVPKATAEIVFGEKTLQESTYNPIVDDRFEGIEPDYSLAPGKISLYRAFIPIPEVWQEEATKQGITQRKVSFVAYDSKMVEGSGMAGQADEEIEYQEYIADPGEVRVNVRRTTLDQKRDQRYMTMVEVDTTPRATPIHDAPVLNGDVDVNGGKYNEVKDGSGRVYDANGNVVDAAGGAGNAQVSGAESTDGGAGTYAGATGGSRTPTAQTGDATHSALPAALGALGAAAMAYSIRRARNEGNSKDEA